MHDVLLFDLLSTTLIMFLVLVILIFGMIALRRVREDGEMPRGFVPFVIVVLGLCAFVSMARAYFHAQKAVEPKRISERMQTV